MCASLWGRYRRPTVGLSTHRGHGLQQRLTFDLLLCDIDVLDVQLVITNHDVWTVRVKEALLLRPSWRVRGW